MGELLSFKKLDYSKEAETITARVFRGAFLPAKIILAITIIGALLFYMLGFGNMNVFFRSDISSYIQLAFWASVLWAFLRLKYGLRCPNCHRSYFRFSRKLQIKPRICPSCKVVFVKKTHPVEDEHNFSREFYMLKIELERRAELAILYLFIGMILFLYILMPLFSGLIGSLVTMFLVLPALVVFSIIHIIKQLEMKCPCCGEYIKWTELKPTEISKHCPQCDVKLVD